MPIHTEYIPQTLLDFEGNEHVIKGLESVFSRDSGYPHTFLFTGPAGCGKTTIGRIVRRLLEVGDRDYREYDTSNTRGIETIREIRANMLYSPQAGKRKAYLLDECHQLTSQAQEALLKAMLEPPKTVHFILCTTDPEKLLPTFLRRCHQYDLKPLMRSQVVRIMKKVLKNENVTNFPMSVLKKIADVSFGSAGMALKWLDQVIDVDNEEEAVEIIEASTFSETQVHDISRLLLDQKLGNKWQLMQSLLKGITGQPEQIRRAILTYMEKVMLGDNYNDRIADIMLCFMDNYYDSGRSGLVLSCYVACKASTKK